MDQLWSLRKLGNFAVRMSCGVWVEMVRMCMRLLDRFLMLGSLESVLISWQ